MLISAILLPKKGVRSKKAVLFPKIGRVKFFCHLPARIVKIVSECTFFVSQEKHIHTEKSTQTKRKRN